MTFFREDSKTFLVVVVGHTKIRQKTTEGEGTKSFLSSLPTICCGLFVCFCVGLRRTFNIRYSIVESTFTRSFDRKKKSPPTMKNRASRDAGNVGNNDDNNKDDNLIVVEATPLLQTTIRQKITPYLPPPVVVAMRRVDPQLEPYIGPEPTVTILGTLCLGLLLLQMIIRLAGGSNRNSRRGAINDDDDDDDINNNNINIKNKYFDTTVLLCGPSLVGKTSLLHRVLVPQEQQQQPILTVKSIRKNIIFCDQTSSTIRYIDIPGHWNPSKLIDTIIMKEKIDRIVLVLDSTQSITRPADYLYLLLKNQITKQQQQQSSSNNSPYMVIACHKSKLPKAKNCRRIRLQLRNELERLAKLDTSLDNNITATTLDWDSVLQEHVRLCETSCNPSNSGLDELLHYCQTGEFK